MYRFLVWAFALIIGFGALPAAPLAQSSELAQTLQDWEGLATRAERAIDLGGGSSTLFEGLRSSIVEYRQIFDAARDNSATRIANLREQIAALGPVPEGEDAAAQEAPDVAAQRVALNAQLSQLLEPVQRAEAAFVRANAIIGQIDRLLRERQTNALFEVYPTPLNPANWQRALDDLMRGLTLLWQEQPALDPELGEIPLGERLPFAIVLMLAGSVLIVRGQQWTERIVRRVSAIGGRGFGIWHFIASLLRIILPFAGLMAVAFGVIIAAVFGSKANEIILTVAALGGGMLAVRWVAERVFAREDTDALILLPARDRTSVRSYVFLITVMIILAELVVLIIEAGFPARATRPIAVLPFYAVSSFALYRIGQLLRRIPDPEDPEGDGTELKKSTMTTLVRLFGTGAVLVAVASVLLLVAGYYNAVDALLPPYIMTLVIFGAVIAVQRFGADVYSVLRGLGVEGRDTLIPILFGMVLCVAILPLLALVWGARLTELAEAWTAITRGFVIGETRISPSDFVVFAVIFAIGYMLTRLVQSALRTNVLPKTKMDVGAQNAVISGLGYVGIFLAGLAAITGAGIDLSSIALVAGALTVGIGFGLQTIVSNFVSGIILLIERPISEGDWIEVGGNMGYVRDISVRSTRIETFDRSDVIVPNADLISGTVTNYTRGNTVGRVIVSVGVAYGTDTKRVESILREIANAQPMVLSSPPPAVLFLNFGADSLEFEVRCFLRDVNWMLLVKNDINHAIAQRFVEEGIEIPFAQRDIWLRNPETLRGDGNADEVPGT